jgi:hypothetical protein
VVCRQWQRTGQCSYGTSCKFKSSHGTGTAVASKPGTGPSRVLFAQQPGKATWSLIESSDDEQDDQEVCAVQVEPAPPAMVCAIGLPARCYLGWDTMAEIHVAKSLSVIPGAQELQRKKKAVGVGGARAITHVGKSDIFDGLEMSYIDGGNTPNLQSVGRVVQRDASGRPAVAIFSENGAVRCRVTPELQTKFAALVEEAHAQGLVEGTAIMQNFVYQQDFGGGDAEVVEGAQVCAVSSNLFASRIRLSNADNVLDFLVAAGLSKTAVLDGIASQSLRGLPALVTKEKVEHYFKYAGKSADHVAAEIATAGLRVPIDHESNVPVQPGEVMQIDNVDPSFSRLLQADRTAESGSARAAARMPVPSVGGYKDAVLAVDEATGFAHLQGRTTKKDPHRVLAHFVNLWRGRWGALRVIKADAEFVTKESVDLVNSFGGRFRQSIPHDHRRNTGLVEGCVRWVQELGQANMNRLRPLIKSGDLTKLEARALWYHALRQAVFAFNMRPSLCDPSKTRYEMGTGEVANLSYIVLMPFGMKLVGRDFGASDGDRGSACVYIGPSATVRGGILTYSLETGRVSVKYSFVPLNDVRRPTPIQTAAIGKQIYGRVLELGQDEVVQEAPNVDFPVVCAEPFRGARSSEGEVRVGEAVPCPLAPGRTLTVLRDGGEMQGEHASGSVPDNHSEARQLGPNAGYSGASLAAATSGAEQQEAVRERASLEPERRTKLPSARRGTRPSREAGAEQLGVEHPKVVAIPEDSAALRRTSRTVHFSRSTGGGADNLETGASRLHGRSHAPAVATEQAVRAAESQDLQRSAQRGKSGGGGASRPDRTVVCNYRTRSRSVGVHAAAQEVPGESGLEDRPPKPKTPSRAASEADPKWKAAGLREAKKLMDEDTLIELPKDASGRYVRPAGAMVLRILKIMEYKWKPDPDTGVERWLECVRYVCDGSADDRPEKYYAETPDRTLLFAMTSIEASLGITAKGSDVVRAYLNAESLDRNIVIIAPSGVEGLPRESLLNKGLYGSKAGALSWQVWIDDKLIRRGFRKLDVARGVYRKDLDSGMPMLLYRHSDDLRSSCADEDGRAREESEIKAVVRMAEFTRLDRFLGCTFERISAVTGQPDACGTLVLVRQTDKIREMEVEFMPLHKAYNEKGRIRQVALPVSAVKEDCDLERGQETLLDEKLMRQYQSLVGSINWVVNSTRPDAKLSVFLLSTRLTRPRQWDMFLAVWTMDYLVGTADTPLVLGGSVVNPEVWADASLALLPERRSIVGHVATTGRGSGAIYTHVGSTKAAVTNIWEAELMAGCEAMNTALYITRACEDMGFSVSKCRSVWVDNQAEIEWVKGSVSNRRSRHIDMRYYRARHLQEQGEVHLQYVPSAENIADILTKPLALAQFRTLAGKILGHDLCRSLGVKGLISADSGSN